MSTKISPMRNKVWMWIWGITTIVLVAVIIHSYTIGDRSAGIRIAVLAFLSFIMFLLRYHLYRQSR